MSAAEVDGVAPPSTAASSNESAAANEPPKPTPLAPSALSKLFNNRLVDWLLVRTELARARAAAAQLRPEQREYLRRAKLSLELGELALAPGNSIRSGSAVPLAVNLFRQAVYWALLVRRPEAAGIEPRQLWTETDRALLEAAAGNESEYAYFTVVMGSTFVQLAEGTAEAQHDAAVKLRRAAQHLIKDAQSILLRLQWAKLNRAVRVGLALLIPVTAIWLLWPAKVDLAKGATFRVSSTQWECHPEKPECGGVKTPIFFHTNNEQNPWFEYDFGKPVSFSSLSIKNRSDCCSDRAVPLLVEVSNDGRSFKQVARREQEFEVWNPSFTPQLARYVRLRVPRESILHLEAIKVYP